MRTGKRQSLGLVLAVISAAAFGTSGSFAKSLLATGWTPLAVVTFRVCGAAVVMLPAASVAVRGRWRLLRRNLGVVLAYGTIAVAGCQLAFFYAVRSLSVGVALLLEYCGIVLVVIWVWLRHGRRPSRLTSVGMVAAVVGLLLVLDVLGGLHVSLGGVAWGLLAAVGLATFYIVSAHEHEGSLPPIALAGFGLAAGAVGLLMAGVARAAPFRASRADVRLAGTHVPWWAAVLELALIAAAFAYAVGIIAARMVGPSLASFAGLTEVLFAVGFAWALLGEAPGGAQALGGVLVLVGVLAVRLGEPPEDFAVAQPIP